VTKNRLVRGAAVAAVAAACGGVTLIGACTTATAVRNGTLVLQLTDAPFSVDSVSRVDVFVVRVDGRQSDADSAAAATGAPDDSASTGGWTTLASPDQSINLLALQDGNTFALGQTTLAAGTYRGFRLVIDPSRSSLTLKNGIVLSGTSTPNVSFPSASRSGIKIVLTEPVTIAADGTTTMVIDFDVANSFVLRGASLSQNGLLFKPVIRGTTE